MNRFIVTTALGICAASSVPGAVAALSWDICTKDESGKKTCRSRIPRSARIAIAVGSLFVLLLIGVLVFCVMRNRRAVAASQEEYNVEASQVRGPPTIIDTAYHPKSGPSGVYSGEPTPPEMIGPSFTLPVAPPTYSADPGRNYTAPVSQMQFPAPNYPFPGYGPPHNGPAMPKSAFVGGGFPRPLLAGARLKDRLKERPDSVASTIPESR